MRRLFLIAGLTLTGALVAPASAMRDLVSPLQRVVHGVVAGAYFTPPSGSTPSTTVASRFQNVVVCLDVDYSGTCDAGEDQATSDELGTFTLTTLRAGQLLALVSTDSTNGLHPIAGREVFRAAWEQFADAGDVALTPRSTEVARLMEAGGLEFDAAETQLASRLGVPVDQALGDPADASTDAIRQALLTEDVILNSRFTLAARMQDRGDVATLAASHQAVMNLEDIPRYDHVFVLVLENRPSTQIKNSLFAPNINKYLNDYNQFISYNATGNPSEPNRLAIAAGDDFGITDDNAWNCFPSGDTANAPEEPQPAGISPCTNATNHNIKHRPDLMTALRGAGMTWRVYSETQNPGRDWRLNSFADSTIKATDHTYPAGSPVGQIGNANLRLNLPSQTYATKHNESVNFQSVRTADGFLTSNRTLGGGQWDAALAAIAPPGWKMDQFGDDLISGDVGNLNYIEPDQCDDMHGLTVTGTNIVTNAPGTASDCGGNALIYRSDLYTDALIKKIMASPLWTNTAKRTAIIISFDEGTATSGLNSCCGWNPAGKPGYGTLGPFGPLVKAADGTVSADTTIANYANGNKGHGASVFGLITNQPDGPRHVIDSDAYSHMSFVRTLQDLFGIADPGDDWSYMNRSKYTESFINANLPLLREYGTSPDRHFDAVRPMNHQFVIPAGYVQKTGIVIPPGAQVGPDASPQLNAWALTLPIAPAPLTTPGVSPSANAAFWHHGPVTVTLNAGGGVASIHYTLSGATTGSDTVAGNTATIQISAEGQTIVSYFATGTAGNRAAARALAVDIDQTAPAIVGGRVPVPNAEGWSNTEVSVGFECGDPLSTLLSCTNGPYTFGEGAGQSVTGEAFDVAGNKDTKTISDINVDLTAPVIAFSGNAGAYTIDQVIDIGCSATDPLSGIATKTCPGASGPAFLFPLGTTTLSASATDKAGNSSSASTSFTVGLTFDSLSSLTQQFVEQKGVASSLKSKLANAAAAAARGDGNAMAGHLTAYINELSAQSGKALTAEHALVLQQLAGVF